MIYLGNQQVGLNNSQNNEFVSYIENQELTDIQKERARDNISAAKIEDLKNYNYGELITDFTIEEDLEQIIIQTDLNNEPFKLRIAKCFIIMPASLTGTADYILAYMGGINLKNELTYKSLPTVKMNSPSSSLNVYEIENYINFYNCRAWSAKGFDYSSSTFNSIFNLSDLVYIDRLRFQQYSQNNTLIPAGTRILLYGVRVQGE